MADAKTISLVEQVQATVAADTVDLRRLGHSLDLLLRHLCSPEGRTDDNCAFVDSYFMANDEWAARGLPDALHDIFADMSGALHDTCSAPHVAQNFDSTPEQLLARLQGINTEPPLSPYSSSDKDPP